VAEDLFDQCVLGGLDERNDAHAPAATGADEGIDTPHVLDEGRPAAAGQARARRVLAIAGQLDEEPIVSLERVDACVRTVRLYVPGTNTYLADGAWTHNDSSTAGSLSAVSSSSSSSSSSNSGGSSFSGSGPSGSGESGFSGGEGGRGA
jgi:hypothetical protein